MAVLRQMALWREARSWTGAIFAIAVGLSLVRVRDQPGLNIAFGSTTATIVPLDFALAALFLVSVATLVRTRQSRLVAATIAAACAFAILVLGTGSANGSAALVAGGRLVELTVLGLGALALVRRHAKLEALVDVLLLFTIAADIVGLVQFFRQGGGRQASFLGEHDFAALAILPLLYGFVCVFEGRRTRRATLAIVAGALGCILGAALASLLGLYLGAVLLVVLAIARKRLDRTSLAVVVVTLAAITGGTVLLRGSELAFLRSWFGPPPSRPGEYAGSWSQRLIYFYVGERVFLAHPALGTGWYPDLPPHTYTVFLPDARKRFSDQPANYFPPADGTFIPQQTYDQILYELGVIGAVVFLALLVSVGRAAVTATHRMRALRDVPSAWFVASLGALAGEGFFGGTPLAATFWLVVGVVVACTFWPDGEAA